MTGPTSPDAAKQSRVSRTAVAAVLVVAFVVLAGGALLLIGLAEGDHAEHIDVPPEESTGTTP